jgi:hypothetical protein
MAASLAMAAPDNGQGPICLPGVACSGGEVIVIIGDAPKEPCEENWSGGVAGFNAEGDCECLPGWNPGPLGPDGDFTCERDSTPLPPDPPPPGGGGGGGSTPSSCASSCNRTRNTCLKTAVSVSKECTFQAPFYAQEMCTGAGARNIDRTPLGGCPKPPGPPSNPGHANPTPLHCCIWGSTANGDFLKKPDGTWQVPNRGWLWGVDSPSQSQSDSWSFGTGGVGGSSTTTVTWNTQTGLHGACGALEDSLRTACWTKYAECVNQCNAQNNSGGSGSEPGNGSAPGQGSHRP